MSTSLESLFGLDSFLVFCVRVHIVICIYLLIDLFVCAESDSNNAEAFP